MKDELIKFIMERADKQYTDDFPICLIPEWINEFFNQYQPERSKREDIFKIAGQSVGDECRRREDACIEEMMRYSEQSGNRLSEVQ